MQTLFRQVLIGKLFDFWRLLINPTGNASKISDLNLIFVLDTLKIGKVSAHGENDAVQNYCHQQINLNSSLCTLCVLCVSVVVFPAEQLTTETQRTQRVHRENQIETPPIAYSNCYSLRRELPIPTAEPSVPERDGRA